MATRRLNGISLAAVGVGFVFVYAGVKGVSVPNGIRAIVTGQSPQTLPQTSPIGQQTSTQVQTSSGSGSANPKSGTWTHGGLMNLWIMAGGSQSSANNAACHAIQESSGNASVTSSNPDGGTNVGLWQLDTRGVGAGHTVAQLQDPMLNAQITVRATNDGQNWSQWATPGC